MNLSALKSRDFRLYLAGNLFSLNALWMLRVIVGWLAWDLTHSPGFVGAIALFYFLPSLFLGPFFGVITDRTDVRLVSIAIQVLFCSSAIVLWLAQFYELLSSHHLLFYAATIGLIISLHSPVRLSLTPRLVPPTGISSAVSITSLVYNISRMTGPAFGGWAIANIGTTHITLITALCYLPFLLALLYIRMRPQEGNATRRRFRDEFAEGMRLAFRVAEIRTALTISALVSIFVVGVLEILPVFADGVFKKGAAGLGILTASGGLGAIISGISISLLPQMSGSRGLKSAAIALTVGALCVGILGQTTTWPVAIVLVAGISACASGTWIICQSVIQTQIADRTRGRVMSIWASMAIGGSAVGAAALGYAVGLLGPSLTMGAASFFAIGLVALNFRQIPR